jgi:hypothetical protein
VAERVKPGISLDEPRHSHVMTRSHDFTQRFLANERQLELDAEADRARLALLARGQQSPRRRLPLAWLLSIAHGGDRSGMTARARQRLTRRGASRSSSQVGPFWKPQPTSSSPRCPLGASSSSSSNATPPTHKPQAALSPRRRQAIDRCRSTASLTRKAAAPPRTLRARPHSKRPRLPARIVVGGSTLIHRDVVGRGFRYLLIAAGVARAVSV